MNLSRYKWPVVIAAGLHSALFFGLPRGEWTPRIKDPAEKPVLREPPPRIEIAEEPAEPTGSSDPAGSVTPMPSTPDLPQLRNDETVLSIPIMADAPRIQTVSTLDKIPPGTVGPMGNPDATGPRGPRIESFLKLDRPPHAVVQGSPDYPYSLRHDGISGSVTVEFVVGTDGQVLSAEAIKWTHREFADPAVRAVLRWKFEPGTIGGRRVRFRMSVPIEFNAAR